METGNNSNSGGAAGGDFSDYTAWEGDKYPPPPAVFAYMCARRRERCVLAEDARSRGVKPRSAAPVTASERVIVTAAAELLGLRRVRGRFCEFVPTAASATRSETVPQTVAESINYDNRPTISIFPLQRVLLSRRHLPASPISTAPLRESVLSDRFYWWL